QDGSSGWGAQTWDLAGNEVNFFIRDFTNGSKLVFRVRPGAPQNSIEIKTNEVYVGNALRATGSTTLEGTLSVGDDVTVSGEIFALSDMRLKTNIRPLTSALSVISALQPKRYVFKTNADREQFGFIAQEVEQVLPELVGQHDLSDSDNPEAQTEAIKTVNYTGFIPVIFQATKEQQELIESQQEEIDALKNEVAELKKLVQELIKKD
ncbi:MAG: tail fiber domain-containing protein, partial [Bacteroidota bacterium]